MEVNPNIMKRDYKESNENYSDTSYILYGTKITWPNNYERNLLCSYLIFIKRMMLGL